MIKTSPKQIAICMGSLEALMGAKLPVKATYAVGKLARACHAAMETYNKDRQKEFEDAGCKTVIKGKNPDGSDREVYEHPEDDEAKTKLKAVQKKTEEMAEVEIEVNALPLDLAQFGDVDLPGNALYGLDWAVKAE